MTWTIRTDEAAKELGVSIYSLLNGERSFPETCAINPLGFRMLVLTGSDWNFPGESMVNYYG